MTTDTKQKAAEFRALHQRDGILVMPNAWDRGSARLLAVLGFNAIATTSAGTNHANGTTDKDYHVPRDEMIAAFGLIARSVEVPCNGDLENGYGDRPEDVAKTVAQSIVEGMAGGNIEDFTVEPRRPLYDLAHAAARIRAARAAADASGTSYVLTARTDSFVVGLDDPFKEAVRRLNAYREAGADVLYAPGLTSRSVIRNLVQEVNGPINFVANRRTAALGIADLEEIGVKRVSLGGALFHAAYGGLVAAARELKEQGTFDWTDRSLDRDVLRRAISGR